MTAPRPAARWPGQSPPPPRPVAAGSPPRRDLAREVVLRDEHARPRVLQHERQAVLRIRRIQRHVRRPRLENAQERHHHLERALQAHAHQHPGARPALHQHVRELVGAAVELAIGERLALELDGDALGGALHLGLDQLVQAGVERVRRLRAVPLAHDLLALRRGEQRQRPDGLIGAGAHRLEHDAEVLEHPSRGARVEQIGLVLEQQPDARAVRPGVEREVELGLDPLLRREQIEGGEAGRQSGEPGIGGAFQEVEHDLKQRTAADVPLGLELLDELLEGEILMRVGLQRRLAHAPEKARTLGSPDRSVRSTRVLTKKPMSYSTSGRVRPAIGIPTITSSCPA